MAHLLRTHQRMLRAADLVAIRNLLRMLLVYADSDPKCLEAMRRLLACMLFRPTSSKAGGFMVNDPWRAVMIVNWVVQLAD